MHDCNKSTGKKSTVDAADDGSVADALVDPETLAFLKDYLAISDEALKAHVRRLVEEIRLTKKKPKT
jgi:hypothetical protein